MKYIKGFDGLRAIAILFVLLNHLGLENKIVNYKFLHKNYNLIDGTNGVMLFFVLSGFLITQILLNEKAVFGQLNLKFFFIRRLLRLTPPLIIFLLIIALSILLKINQANWYGVFYSLFYSYNYIPRKLYSMDLGHTWSLAVEEQYYLIWALCLFYIKKNSTLLITCVVSILLSILLLYFYSLTKPSNLFSHWKQNYFFERWFFPASLPLLLGSLISILVYFNKMKGIPSKWYFILFIIFYFVQIPFHKPTSFVFELSQIVGACFLVLWIYSKQDHFLVTILEFKPIVLLGKISYGLYIYQGFFLRTGPYDKLAVTRFPVNIILTFSVALISYFFIEKKILSYKGRFYQKG